MKKKVLIALSLLIVSGTIQAQDKAFRAGNIVVDVGLGGAGYKTLLSSTITTGTVSVKNEKNGTAGSVIYPIQVEYGLRNWLGIGARFAYSKYYDSTKSNRGIDFDFVLNFHLIKTKRFEMPISLFLGYSNLNIKYKDVLNTIAKDNGMSNGIMLIPRFYITKHFGLFVNVGFVNYVYPSLTFTNNSNKSNINPAQINISLAGNGETFGFGALYKF